MSLILFSNESSLVLDEVRSDATVRNKSLLQRQILERRTLTGRISLTRTQSLETSIVKLTHTIFNGRLVFTHLHIK
jgi:hypothetical protein